MMEGISYHRATQQEELEQILELQRKNSPEAVTNETLERDGFITVRHNLELLNRMNNSCAHILAKDGFGVVGYALCMHPIFKNEISIIAPMFNRAEALLRGETFMVMGQICIDKDYRRKGIFRTLYQKMKEAVIPEFSCIVTEVDDRNQRSLNAHLAVGFRVLENYNANGRNWHLLVLR